MKLIATWEMSKVALDNIKSNNINDAIIEAIKMVENNVNFTSVGYGGLPNIHGKMQFDAAFMCGKTMSIGCLCAAENIINPIEVAFELSKERFNSFRAGAGVYEFAREKKLATGNMLSLSALSKYNNRIEEIKAKNLSPYDGHDTVCILGMDFDKDISVGTSTSGLFMKENGRVGDSPISGSGFYARNKIGACAATGLGEDIMKTIISYKICELIDNGYTAMEACEKAVSESNQLLLSSYGKAGDISVVAIDKNGNFGAASNRDYFTYVTYDNGKVEVHNCKKC